MEQTEFKKCGSFHRFACSELAAVMEQLTEDISSYQSIIKDIQRKQLFLNSILRDLTQFIFLSSFSSVLGESCYQSGNNLVSN